MANEIETKVLDIDTNSLKRKLVKLGAKKLRHTKLVVDWYRTIGVTEGKDEWFLRIRFDSSGTHEITWKARSEIIGKVRRHKEINFLLNEPEKMADLLLEIGLEKYAHQEKMRTSYTLKGWSFDIDQYPSMPAFIEIEGKSEAHIGQALKLLGLTENRTWAKGERILIQDIYKLNWYDMRFAS